ncbi:hypothetical protein BDR07DRAFT_1407873 [Suillus spraguei]|nr:hypothetical protein BDR07DRAFT_1407873 [Suillus spraguei]
MNNRPQALWALNKLISGNYSSDCESDLFAACMTTNDHAIFRQLKFKTSCEPDWRVRSFLGCPRDKVEVHICDEAPIQFNVVLQIGMFQKRLGLDTTLGLYYAFVAEGRIWWFRFNIQEPTNGIWHAEIGLWQHSRPVRLNAVLLIEAHSQKQAVRATLPEALKIPLSLPDTKFLVPWTSTDGADCRDSLPPNNTWRISNEVGDWVTHNKTPYLDHEGTLHAKLEMTLL